MARNRRRQREMLKVTHQRAARGKVWCPRLPCSRPEVARRLYRATVGNDHMSGRFTHHTNDTYFTATDCRARYTDKRLNGRRYTAVTECVAQHQTDWRTPRPTYVIHAFWCREQQKLARDARDELLISDDSCPHNARMWHRLLLPAVITICLHSAATTSDCYSLL